VVLHLSADDKPSTEGASVDCERVMHLTSIRGKLAGLVGSFEFGGEAARD
jgi:hypothetical protein